MKNNKLKFIRLPLKWSQRKDITPSFKLVIGYINTRSTIILRDGGCWTISAGDVVFNTGLSDSQVRRIINRLISVDILQFSSTKKGVYKDYKIYKINRKTLLTYMKATPNRVVELPPTGGQSYPQGGTIEEDNTIEQDKIEKGPTSSDLYSFDGNEHYEDVEYRVNQMMKLDEEYKKFGFSTSMYNERKKIIMYGK